MQRMAAHQAPQCQPAALECAEARDRFHRIDRTRRMEAAGWTDQWTDPALVATQHQDKQAIYHDSFMPTGSYWRLFMRGLCAPVSPCIQVRGKLRKNCNRNAVAAVAGAGYNSALSRYRVALQGLTKGALLFPVETPTLA